MSIIWQAPTISTHVAGTAGFSIPGIANANRRRPTFNDGSSFAIYNSLVSFMSRALSLSRTALCKLLVIYFLLLGSAGAAVDWTQLERDLSAKIAGATGPGAISLDLVNRASFGKGELDSIRRSLITQLSTLGIQVVKPDQAGLPERRPGRAEYCARRVAGRVPRRRNQLISTGKPSAFSSGRPV